MGTCSQCASPIPPNQRICSMCMGDIDHGSDRYYRDLMERQQPDEEMSDEERAAELRETRREYIQDVKRDESC